MLASSGIATPPTQWITRAEVTLRSVLILMLAAGAVLTRGDAVPDCDLLGSDEDVLDEEPQDALAFGDLRGLCVAAKLGEEAVEVVGEFEVGVAVGELG